MHGGAMLHDAVGGALAADVATGLELMETIAWRDAFAAAAAMPGNPAGATWRDIAGGVVTALTVLDDAFFNRGLGFGIVEPLTAAHIDDLTAFHLALGRTWSLVQPAPPVLTPVIEDALVRNGFARGRRWAKTWRSLETPLPEASTGLRIERIGDDHADAFADIVTTAMELEPETRAITRAIVARPSWHQYLGFDGERPVAAGAMYVVGGMAWLGMGATLEEARGRGGQSAMFARRLRDAADLGCRFAFTETGEETPEAPNASYRNMLRAGFRLAYHRPNWVRRPPDT